VRDKPYPIRTCIVCGHKDYKSNLLRIACHEGEIRLDKEQKFPGRGVYVCTNVSCLQKLNSSRIQKRLINLLQKSLQEVTYKKFQQEVKEFLSKYGQN